MSESVRDFEIERSEAEDASALDHLCERLIGRVKELEAKIEALDLESMESLELEKRADADIAELTMKAHRAGQRALELEAAIRRACAGDASGPGLARLYALVSDES